MLGQPLPIRPVSQNVERKCGGDATGWASGVSDKESRLVELLRWCRPTRVCTSLPGCEFGWTGFIASVRPTVPRSESVSSQAENLSARLAAWRGTELG